MTRINLKPPSEMDSYQYDPAIGRSPLPVLVLGWLSFVAFLLAVLASVFLRDDEKVTSCAVSYAVFIVLFIAYVIAKVLTRQPRCSRCKQVMDVMEVKWTPEEWLEVQKYEMIDALSGADGYLYATERRKETGSLPFCSIWAQLQIWCACHNCRRYFLKARHSRRQVFATPDDEEFDRVKHSLLSDPGAGEAIESAYKEAYEAALRGKR